MRATQLGMKVQGGQDRGEVLSLEDFRDFCLLGLMLLRGTELEMTELIQRTLEPGGCNHSILLG